MQMKVELYQSIVLFDHNMIGRMSAITSERYINFSKTSFLIKIILLKHFALEVYTNGFSQYKQTDTIQIILFFLL